MPRTIDFSHHLCNLSDNFGNQIDTDMLKAYCNTHSISYATITKYLNQYKIGRGKWDLTVEQAKQKLETIVDNNVSLSKTAAVVQNLIPQKDDTFVQFGNFSSLKKVIASRLFYPVFIT